MGSQWNSDHMCDDGINEVIENFQEGIGKIIRAELHKCTTASVSQTAKVLENLFDGWESLWENVVIEIDGRMEEVKDETGDSLIEAGEYVTTEHYDILECEKNEIEAERDDLLVKAEEIDEKNQEISDLEDKINVISMDGEDYTWIPSRKCMVSKTGRVFTVQEVDDCSVSANM
jgi:hypothetical protein